MNITELTKIVSRFRYKPGYRFEVEPYETDGMATIVLFMRAPDARDPARRMVDLELRQRFPLPRSRWPSDDVGFVTLQIDSMVRQAEIHESQEWLTLDGKLVRDPHL